jgi:hypothetical protein
MTRDDFDSMFHIPTSEEPINSVLTLHLRVYLERVDARVYQKHGRVFRARPWAATEWNNFVYRYQNIAQQFWNKRFWLIPPENYAGLDLPSGKPTYRPNIRCLLQLQPELNPRASWHAKVRVVCLEDDEQRFFRFTYRLPNSGETNNSSEGEGSFQLPVALEVGHLLGLPFSLANGEMDNPPDAPLERCHGRAGFKWDEILDPRTVIQELHAQPWCQRIAEHTQTDPSAWRIALHEVPPRPLVVLPVPSVT